MNIKVLGPGCKNCQALEKEVKTVLEELKIEAQVEKVTDLSKIMDYNVLMTPGLVINENLKVFGRVPKKEEIKKWIQEEVK
ncbi:MAG: thioredoxin family protein [Firmicutes bacterium]|nr:thioredoxin family protein [Bacillota bacterium]